MKILFVTFLVMLLNINFANAQIKLDLHIYNNTNKTFTFNIPAAVKVPPYAVITLGLPFQAQDKTAQYSINEEGLAANDLKLNVYGPPANGNADEYEAAAQINLWGDRKTSNGAQYAARSWDFKLHVGALAHAYVIYHGMPTWPKLDTISIHSMNDGQSYYYNSQANANIWNHGIYNIATFGGINSVYNQSTGIGGAAGAIQGYTIWNNADISFTWYKTAAGFTPLGRQHTGDTTGYDVIINALPSNQTNFDEAYVFGDSLSDNHIVYDASYGNLPKGPFYDGRWTNGLNWVDQLQKATGLPVLDFAFGGADIADMMTENKVKKPTEVVVQGIAGTSGVPRVPNLEQEIFASAFHSPQISTNFNGNIPATATQATTTANLFKGPSAYQYIAATLAKPRRVAIFVLMGGNDYWNHFHSNNPNDNDVKIFAQSLANTEMDDLARINLNLISAASQAKYHSCSQGKCNLPQIFVLTLPNLALVPSYSNAVEPGNFSIYLNNDLQAAVKIYNAHHSNCNNFHIIPLYSFVQAIAKNPALFGYSSASSNDPKEASIFGTWSTAYPMHTNAFNFMGAQGYSTTDYLTDTLVVHVALNLLPALAYQQAAINKFIFAGKTHPSAKTHALISYDIDYWLMQHGFFKGGTDPANYTGILKLVAENQGMMADTNATAFNALLKLADQASQPRPSFTSQITTTLNRPATLAANINGPAALSVSGKQVVAMWVVDNQGVKTLYRQGGQLNMPNGAITWQGQPTLVAQNASQPTVAIIPGSTHMLAAWVTKDGAIAYTDGNNGNYWHIAEKLPVPGVETSPSIAIDKNGNVLLSWVNKENRGAAGFVKGTLASGGKAVTWQDQSYAWQDGNITAISTAILPGDKLVEFWTNDHYNLFYRFGTLSASKIAWNSQITQVTEPETLTHVVEPKVKWVGEQNGQSLLALMWRDDAHNKIGLNYATLARVGTNTWLGFSVHQTFTNIVYSPALAFSTIGSTIYSIIGGAAEKQSKVKPPVNQSSTITTYPYQVAGGYLVLNDWPESLAAIPTYLRMQRRS